MCRPKQIEITPIYGKVFWQNITHEAKHVFIGVLSFMVGKLAHMHASFHSCKGFNTFFISNDGFL